jgi:hypothetical protein
LLRLDPADAARAEGEFRRELDVARSQSARLFDLRAARDLARLWRDQGASPRRATCSHRSTRPSPRASRLPTWSRTRVLLEELGAVPVDGAERRRKQARTLGRPDYIRAPASGR